MKMFCVIDAFDHKHLQTVPCAMISKERAPWQHVPSSSKKEVASNNVTHL